MLQRNLSLQDLEIITTISESKKTKVSLVSIRETQELAVLKKYPNRQALGCYEQIRDLKSECFPMIYEVWEQDGETYLLEEYVPGETLQEKLEKELLFPQKELTKLCRQICMALQVLHHAMPPIIHRDIKPENIMITPDGKVKLIDFDAAREYKAAKERDTVMMGTKEYASPEQYGFMQTDIRSDIYSWGIVFAELLAHASVGQDYRQKARKIIDKATMFDPERRYVNTAQVLQDLESLDKRNHFMLPGLGLVGLICVVLLFVFVVRPREDTGEKLHENSGTQQTVSLESEQYHYISIEDEVKEKVPALMENRGDLYGGSYFNDNDSGMYSELQECIIGKDYQTLRFLRNYPRDIVICDNRMEGSEVEQVFYYPYLVEEKTDGDKVVLTEGDYSKIAGNVFSISAECLQKMEPGAYTLHVWTSDMRHAYYLIVHGEEEEVDNFRVHVVNNIAYYSSEKQNDVIFYVNNTPYPILQIQLEDVLLKEEDYQLVEAGFGVVFHPQLLNQYADLESIKLVLTMENGKKVMCRIINLAHF